MVGLPSRRLSGDYLAIVTLFFLQLFQTLTTNGDSVIGHDITGGPFGILNVDPFSFFGHTLVVHTRASLPSRIFYVALAFFAVVFVALRFVNTPGPAVPGGPCARIRWLPRRWACPSTG